MDEIIEMVDEEQQYLEGRKDIYLQEDIIGRYHMPLPAES